MSRQTSKNLMRFTSLLSLLLMVLSSQALAQPRLDPESEWPPLPPQLAFDVPANAVEARAQDLTLFRSQLYLNRSYSFAARTRAEEIVQSVAANIDTLSDIGFQIALHRAAALGNNAHSSIREGGFARNFGSIPLRGYFFEDGYHILRTGPGLEQLLGARVSHIEGQPLKMILAALRDLVGGPDVYFETVQADLLIWVPALLHGLGLAERPDRLTIGLDFGDGQSLERTVMLAGPDAESQFEKGWVNLIPSALPDGSEWAGLLDEDDAPGYLQNWDNKRSFGWLTGGKIPYLRLRSLRDSDEGTFEEFLGTVAEELAAARASVLIIDYRLAYGGDYTATSRFFSELGELLAPGARIFALTSHATFSAGILSLASLKQAAGDQLTIVGEAVGDRERFWAEAINFHLPNSRLRIYYALQLHDIRGCHNPSICFPEEPGAFLAVGSLAPDISVPLRFEDYAAGRDAAMENILAKTAAR